MFKTLMVAFFALLYFNSGIALATTAEKVVCSKDGVDRVVRLQAPAKGQAPCKVFYFKRDPADPTDAKAEEGQESGVSKPIYYSTGNGGFCVRMMDRFLKDKRDHGWNCITQ